MISLLLRPFLLRALIDSAAEQARHEFDLITNARHRIVKAGSAQSFLIRRYTVDQRATAMLQRVQRAFHRSRRSPPANLRAIISRFVQ